jgi:hypothetical protein
VGPRARHHVNIAVRVRVGCVVGAQPIRRIGLFPGRHTPQDMPQDGAGCLWPQRRGGYSGSWRAVPKRPRRGRIRVAMPRLLFRHCRDVSAGALSHRAQGPCPLADENGHKNSGRNEKTAPSWFSDLSHIFIITVTAYRFVSRQV